MKGKRLDTWCALMAGRLALEEFGWTRHTFGQPLGPSCPLGAIASAASTDGYSHSRAAAATRAAVALSAVLPPTTDNGSARVILWNDYFARSKEEVLAAFDRALAAVESSASETRERKRAERGE